MSDAEQTLPNPNPSGQELSPEQSVPIDPVSLARHYEVDDVDFRGILRFGAAIVAGSVVVIVLLWVVLRIWTERPLPVEMQLAPAVVNAPVVPGPGLDAAPEVHLENLLQQQSELLTTYGWVNREAGVVHIPIAEAMKLLVERGVPARDGNAPDFRLDPSFRMDSSGGVMPVGGNGEAGNE